MMVTRVMNSPLDYGQNELGEFVNSNDASIKKVKISDPMNWNVSIQFKFSHDTRTFL